MGYRRLYTELERIGRDELLLTPNTRAIARKAGFRAGTLTTTSVPTGTIWATFSLLTPVSGPFVFGYGAGATPFPDAGSFSRYVDMTGAEEVRLLVNVVSGGTGANLAVTGAGVSASISLAAPDLAGDWTQVTATGATLLEWSVSSASVGSVVLGLVQLQGR